MADNNKNPLLAFSDAMAEAVERAGAATVTVDTRKRLPGSGVAIAADLVLTADHVVEREEDLRVILPDGTVLGASLAGRDPGSDLAVLRVERPVLAVAQAAAEPARVGQLALALGRPSDEGIQASLGVVSAIGGPVRTRRGGLLESYLRTDTIPYPGFSGGPLVDAAGRVLGINTSGLGGGAAVTIPAELAWQVGTALAEHGHIRRGYLGVRSQQASVTAVQQQALGRSQETGLLLVLVEDGSPAAKGGLLVGDILVALEGQPVGDPDELLTRLATSRVGESTPVQVLRGGQPATLNVTIGERE